MACITTNDITTNETLCRKRPWLPARDRKSILAKVAKAVSFVHSLGWAILDLKWDNVLLTGDLLDPEVKVWEGGGDTINTNIKPRRSLATPFHIHEHPSHLSYVAIRLWPGQVCGPGPFAHGRAGALGALCPGVSNSWWHGEDLTSRATVYLEGHL